MVFAVYGVLGNLKILPKEKSIGIKSPQNNPYKHVFFPALQVVRSGVTYPDKR